MKDPVQDAARAGFQALLRGDTAERDRQVARAQAILRAQEQPPAVDISRDQIVANLLKLAAHEAGRSLTADETAAIQQNPAALMKHLIAKGYRVPSGVLGK